MNKNLHRIVFNAKRGLRMVVQETAKSTGKGTSKATTGAGGAIAAGAAALAPMVVGAALAGIYGNDISIGAGTLENDAETVNGATKAATIAARNTLNIGAGTINNREHSLSSGSSGGVQRGYKQLPDRQAGCPKGKGTGRLPEGRQLQGSDRQVGPDRSGTAGPPGQAASG
jgi:hypothetical protein